MIMKGAKIVVVRETREREKITFQRTRLALFAQPSKRSLLSSSWSSWGSLISTACSLPFVVVGSHTKRSFCSCVYCTLCIAPTSEYFTTCRLWNIFCALLSGKKFYSLFCLMMDYNCKTRTATVQRAMHAIFHYKEKGLEKVEFTNCQFPWLASQIKVAAVVGNICQMFPNINFKLFYLL